MQNARPAAGVDSAAAAEFDEVLQAAATHTKRVARVRAHIDDSATIRTLLKKHNGFFGERRQLYHPHDILNGGYLPSSGSHRFAMSYAAFVSWLGCIDLGEVVEDGALTFSYEALKHTTCVAGLRAGIRVPRGHEAQGRPGQCQMAHDHAGGELRHPGLVLHSDSRLNC